jgi:hypothetical protein
MLVGLLLATMPVRQLARDRAEPERLWVLPFTQAGADESLTYLEEALPALLMVAITGSGEAHAIVERERLTAILAEQSLSLEQLTTPATRLRVGRLLGATIMISGSFAGQDQALLVTMRATDLESGIVVSSADERGSIVQSAELVLTLYRRLSGNLNARLPPLSESQIDPAPLANLHFMKGLGHYYSARYSRALGEFMLAADDYRVRDIARFWQANAWLAQRQYTHACLELARLQAAAPRDIPAGDIATRLRTCERYLTNEDLKVIRDLASRRDPPGR